MDMTKVMQKLKYNSTVATPVEKEISLPYYYQENKYSGTLVKIESEDRVITVIDYEGGCYVSVKKLERILGGSEIDKGIPCTEQEFNSALTSALSKIQNL
jgi:hypothetical protein